MIFDIDCLQATFVSVVGYEIKILGEMQPAEGGIWNVASVLVVMREDILRSIGCSNLHRTR